MSFVLSLLSLLSLSPSFSLCLSKQISPHCLTGTPIILTGPAPPLTQTAWDPALQVSVLCASTNIGIWSPVIWTLPVFPLPHRVAAMSDPIPSDGRCFSTDARMPSRKDKIQDKPCGSLTSHSHIQLVFLAAQSLCWDCWIETTCLHLLYLNHFTPWTLRSTPRVWVTRLDSYFSQGNYISRDFIPFLGTKPQPMLP